MDRARCISGRYGLFARGFLGDGGLGGGRGVGDGLVDYRVKLLGGFHDLGEGSALAVGFNDKDGGGALDAGALGEGDVGVDIVGQLALGIDGEGQAEAVALGELLGEFGQRVGVVDGALIGEDLVAVFVADGLAFRVEPAGVDGGVAAPVVIGDEKVVADPGDLVLGGSGFESGIGDSAGGALEVIELDDGDAGAGGGMERGGVEDLDGVLRAGCGDGEHGEGEYRGLDEAGAGEEVPHIGLTMHYG